LLLLRARMSGNNALDDAMLRALERQFDGESTAFNDDDEVATTTTSAVRDGERAYEEGGGGGASPSAVAAEKPTPRVEAPRDTAIEPVRTYKCSVCARAVAAHHDRVLRGECGHVVHTTCLARLVRAGQGYCSECPPPARSADDARREGGYTLDAGNDVRVRESLATVLAHRRNLVRDDFIAATERAGTCARAHRTRRRF
jgi:hypothetical protein